jgi:hypothetical protein
MKTADEFYKAELEKFKEKMKKAIYGIDMAVYLLECGTNDMEYSVGDILKQYAHIGDDVRNAFDELNKNKGDEYNFEFESPTSNFVEQCLLSFKN